MDITVIGSCNIDLISYVDRFPTAGETICGHKFDMGCGGKGANQCVAAAKLGATTAMIGCVGNDTFGKMYQENFTKLSVNTDHLHVISDISTGVAPITVTKEGENSIVIVKGANDCLHVQHIDGARSLIETSKIILCQLEIQPDVTLHALKLATTLGVKTIFNPAPALANLSVEFLQNTHILCCNETEAEILTSCQVDSTPKCIAAVRTLLTKGPKVVVLTLGSKGAMFGTTEKPDLVQHVTPDTSSTDTDVVDTTGAGDCFVGSLAYYLSKRNDLKFEEIIRRAVAIATLSVTKHGTQTSYPTWDNLSADLKV